MKEILVIQMKDCMATRVDNNERVNHIENISKILFHTSMREFQQNWHKASLERGDTKYIFFQITTGQISTKLDTKHPWMNVIQVCTNEDECD